MAERNFLFGFDRCAYCKKWKLTSRELGDKKYPAICGECQILKDFAESDEEEGDGIDCSSSSFDS